MTTIRERAVEAAARALVGHVTPVEHLDNLPSDRAALRQHHRAGGDLMDSQDDLRAMGEAAFDAIVGVLMEPVPEMLDVGISTDHLRSDRATHYDAHWMRQAWKTMLRRAAGRE